MVCKCDRRAREERETIWQYSNVTNIRFCGQFTLIRNNVLKPRAIKDAIREIDAEICEE